MKFTSFSCCLLRLAQVLTIAFVLGFCNCSGTRDGSGVQNVQVSEVIRFSSDGVELEGTVETLNSRKQSPLMIFVHESGPVTRAAYQSYVDHFKPRGFAIFRYDKRGVGTSGGVYNGVSANNSLTLIPQLARDANAAVQALKVLPFIDSTQIILIGSSQAGWIIPCAATFSHNIHLMINVVGPTVTVGEEIYYSNLVASHQYTADEISQLLAAYSGTKGFDPVGYITPLRSMIDGLWIMGGKDESIPTNESVVILARINVNTIRPFEIKIYPDASHGMVNQTTGRLEDFLGFIDTWTSDKIIFPN